MTRKYIQPHRALMQIFFLRRCERVAFGIVGVPPRRYKSAWTRAPLTSSGSRARAHAYECR